MDTLSLSPIPTGISLSTQKNEKKNDHRNYQPNSNTPPKALLFFDCIKALLFFDCIETLEENPCVINKTIFHRIAALM